MKFLMLALTILMAQSSLAQLVIYSDRNPAWFQTAIAEFESQTGEEVIFLEVGSSEMFPRLASEGSRTQADVIISKDLMYITPIVDAGLTQALPEVEAFSRVPEGMIAQDRSFAAFTYRARAVIYNTNTVSADELTTYAALAQEKWNGSLCVRSGTHDYNLSLVASLVIRNGFETAKSIVSGWMGNLAQPPFGKDSHVIGAVADGSCKVGIINHYYLGQALAADPSLPVAYKFLNQNQGGTHTNGTAVMLSRFSGKKDLAELFLKSLYKDESLLEVSSNYFDYPASVDLRANTVVGEWGQKKDGSFVKEGINWLEIGEKRSEAIEINTSTGWD